MTQEERLKTCMSCSNRKLDVQIGIVCSLTDKKATFENSCPNFKPDPAAIKKEEEKRMGKGEVAKGRNKTLNMFYGLLALSILVILFSHFTFKPFEIEEISKELVRLGLSTALFYAVFVGYNWARIVLLILYGAAMIFSLFSMIHLLGKSPFALIIFLLVSAYAYAFYYFNADKDFLAFFESQKKKLN